MRWGEALRGSTPTCPRGGRIVRNLAENRTLGRAVSRKKASGGQESPWAPESHLSLRPAGASSCPPQASKQGVPGGEANFQSPPEGGARPAVSVSPARSLCFGTPPSPRPGSPALPPPPPWHAGGAHLRKHRGQLLPRGSYGRQLGLPGSFLEEPERSKNPSCSLPLVAWSG